MRMRNTRGVVLARFLQFRLLGWRDRSIDLNRNARSARRRSARGVPPKGAARRPGLGPGLGPTQTRGRGLALALAPAAAAGAIGERGDGRTDIRLGSSPEDFFFLV